MRFRDSCRFSDWNGDVELSTIFQVIDNLEIWRTEMSKIYFLFAAVTLSLAGTQLAASDICGPSSASYCEYQIPGTVCGKQGESCRAYSIDNQYTNVTVWRCLCELPPPVELPQRFVPRLDLPR